MKACAESKPAGSPTGHPWLSVIIPSHGGERWLDVALQSVVDQHVSGIEVILIDSTETGKCCEIAQAFSGKLNLQIYSRPDLLPWTVKTNFGVSRAKSEWLSMLHQDDFWLPNRCATLRGWLQSASNAVMHLHPSYIGDRTGKKLGLWRCPLPGGESPVPADMLIRRLLVQNFIAIPAPVIRRPAFLQVGGLDERLWYTADWDLYLKLTLTGDIYYHHEPLTCFRIHKMSQTVSGSQSIDDFKEQHDIVLRRHGGRVPEPARKHTLRLAAASAKVNTALAGAINGNPAAVFKALVAVLTLRPLDIGRYFRYSRLIDRLIPRLRARFNGEW